MKCAHVLVVYPAPWLGWEVVEEGSTEPVSFDDEDDAIRFANSVAASLAPSKVQLEDARGQVRAEWEVCAGATYERAC